MPRVVQVFKEILAALNREVHHFQLKAMFSMGFITYRCSSRCKTCNIWQRNDGGQEGELTDAQWLTVLKRLDKYGIEAFEVFGGDAFLRKAAVLDIVRFCKDRGIETYLPTNSINCSTDVVKGLVAAGLGTIYLSLDDIDENSDEIRGVESSYGVVIKTLLAFAEEKRGRDLPKIVICTTLSNLNYQKFEKIVNVLDDYSVSAIYPRPLGEFSDENIKASEILGVLPEPYFSSSDDRSHLLTKDQYLSLHKQFSNLKNNNSGNYINFRGDYLSGEKAYTEGLYPQRHCHIASLLVTILPNGDVTPCPFFQSYVIGSLLEQDLDEIWGNEKHKHFVRLQRKKKIPICANCNMRVDYPTMFELLRYYFMRASELCRQKLPQ